ncbi:winged helix-turn-helix transcriptional regulator [Nonomuraea candida]|uniref:winged helix-turn-helix transcriptional regulator n=1 Tax=Nonomuraea candida TaxID=359159 RepID=UPI0034E08676
MSDVFNSDCPGRTVFVHVTSRWGMLILAALRDGPLRFYLLRDRIGGISEKMLSQNLRDLVQPARPRPRRPGTSRGRTLRTSQGLLFPDAPRRRARRVPPDVAVLDRITHRRRHRRSAPA